MFQRGQIGEGAAAAIMMPAGARRGAGALLALDASGAAAGRPAMADVAARPPTMPRRRGCGAPASSSSRVVDLRPAGAVRRLSICCRSFVVVLNSFRDLPEIAADGLIALAAQLLVSTPGARPGAPIASAAPARASQRNFFNSLKMTIPATIISTALGAINGYILSKWRFRGSEVAVQLHDCSACSCPARSR